MAGVIILAANSYAETWLHKLSLIRNANEPSEELHAEKQAKLLSDVSDTLESDSTAAERAGALSAFLFFCGAISVLDEQPQKLISSPYHPRVWMCREQ